MGPIAGSQILPFRLVAVALSLAGVLGCAGDAPVATLAVTCSGKCDGLGERLRALVSDARRVDTGDLVSVASGFATDALNGELAAGGATAHVGSPKLYGLAADAASDLTLGDLDALTTGLAARFGENELTTAVNVLRGDHLRFTTDEVFAEGSFTIAASVSHNWNLATGGFGAFGTAIGFTGGLTLEARIIAAYSSELRATGGAMLDGLMAARGFLLPRSIEDIASMKPGESFALHGAGTFGVNLGAGLPILVANPVSAIAYSIVISAALRAQIEGELDVQLVRLDGDEVIVDVGVERAAVRSARIAVNDGWGVDGLLETHVNLGGISIDLGRLAERALEKRLNQHLGFVAARAERSGVSSRLTMARLRFSLDQLTYPTIQALTQALRGDVRLAQALANAGSAGVQVDFDLFRGGTSSTSDAGISLFGMDFFATTIERSGSAVIQTPGGVRTLLFESLHREAGWFFSSHGYTRVGLSGLVYDPRAAALPETEANLFVQVMEGDSWMERDKLLDQLDGFILGLAGPEALTSLAGYGNQIEVLVEAACSPSSGPGAPCRTAVLTDPAIVSLRDQALAALPGLTRHIEPAQAALVQTAAALRLTAQMTLEPAAGFVGPSTSVVLDYRLDDAALSDLFTWHAGAELSANLLEYLTAVGVDRATPDAEVAAARDRVVRDSLGALDDMAAIFDRHAADYAALEAIENASIEGLGVIGARALEIRVPIDASNAPIYAEATARTVAQARAQTAMALFDDLRAAASGLGRYPEHTVAYGLLALTPSGFADVRLDVKMDLSDRFGQSFGHYRAAGYAPVDLFATGATVAPIDGGLFNIDALIDIR